KRSTKTELRPQRGSRRAGPGEFHFDPVIVGKAPAPSTAATRPAGPVKTASQGPARGARPNPPQPGSPGRHLQRPPFSPSPPRTARLNSPAATADTTHPPGPTPPVQP